jgi:Fe2+ or Zn2+ uptake regulation protein
MTHSNITGIIKEAGLKATPQRKIIYEIMLDLGHSPIDEITEKVKQQNSEITVSTVYRILDSFCNAGLISKLKHPNGKWFFDITPSDHHHIFTNDEVIDYINPELTELVKKHLQGEVFDSLKIEKISIKIIATKKTE